MKRVILALTATLLTFPTFAAHYDKKRIDNIYENEATELRYSRRGNFPKAFSMLSETAASGMKNSQHTLGFMPVSGAGASCTVHDIKMPIRAE